MAEEHDESSKTEEPTQRKLDEARRKGDVAKSADLPAFAALAAASGVLIVGGGWLSSQLVGSLLPFVASPHEFAMGPGGVGEVYKLAVMASAPILLAVMVAAAGAGAAGNFLQHGLLWSPDKLAFKSDKISPLAGFKRLFGIDGLVQFLKSLIKMLVIVAVCWMVIKPHLREFESLALLPSTSILPLTRDLSVGLIGGVLAALALGAAIDFFWQRHRFMQRMRMSREELKQDYRQSEGDPHVKARLKQIRAERSKQRMMANVPKATVVVMNPTHYAVALRYEPGETPAPICVAKGVDSLALKIRALAEEHGVTIVEDPPLARSLHKSVDVDETIPREHYEAVAKIVSFVMNRGRAPAQPRRTGNAARGATGGMLND